MQQLKKGITAFMRYKSFQNITAHRMRDAGYNLCSTLVGGHHDSENGDIERDLEVLLSRRPAPIETVLLALSMSFVTKDILQPFGDLQASLPEPFQGMELVKSKSSTFHFRTEYLLVHRKSSSGQATTPPLTSRVSHTSRRAIVPQPSA